MKLALLVSLPALAITGFLSVYAVNSAVSSLPTPTISYVTPVKAPVRIEAQEAVTIAPQTIEIPQEAPIVVTTPTNEELKAQYGWTQGIYRDSINMMIEHYPQYFTDELREISFKYIKDTSPAPEEGGISYFCIRTRSQLFSRDVWLELGLRAGVDNSSF